MEAADLVFSIIASLLSIIATVVSLRARSEVKKVRDEFQGNKLVAKGNSNAQLVGSANKVGVDER